MSRPRRGAPSSLLLLPLFLATSSLLLLLPAALLGWHPQLAVPALLGGWGCGIGRVAVGGDARRLRLQLRPPRGGRKRVRLRPGPAGGVARPAAELHQELAQEEEEEEVSDWLDAEIAAFAASALPREGDSGEKLRLLEVVGRLARDVFGEKAKLYGFGSSFNGCGEAKSDVDACLYIPPSKHADERYYASSHALRQLLTKFEDTEDAYPLRVLEKRLGAGTPIVNFELLSETGEGTGYTCDLSFIHILPLYNTRLLRTYADLSPAVPALVLVVKRWAKANGLAKTFEHFISSYSWTLMVVYYLQVICGLPSLHTLAVRRPASRGARPGAKISFDVRFVADAGEARALLEPDEAEALEALNSMSLSGLLRGFFRFYAQDFEWEGEVVSARRGIRRERGGRGFSPHLSETVVRLKGKWTKSRLLNMLNIEDPIERQRNLNFALRKDTAEQILSSLRAAHSRLDAPLAARPGTLAALIGEEPEELSQVQRPRETWLDGCLPPSKLSEKWPCRCQQCGKLYPEYVKMLNHLISRVCRFNKPSFQCTFCKQGFAQEQDLLEHKHATGHWRKGKDNAAPLPSESGGDADEPPSSTSARKLGATPPPSESGGEADEPPSPKRARKLGATPRPSKSGGDVGEPPSPKRARKPARKKAAVAAELPKRPAVAKPGPSPAQPPPARRRGKKLAVAAELPAQPALEKSQAPVAKPPQAETSAPRHLSV